MASKKKAVVKTAKKTIPAKKSAPAKKTAGNGKTAKAAPAKKAAPQHPKPSAKPAKVAKPAAKAPAAKPSAHPTKKPVIKKSAPIQVKEEKKPVKQEKKLPVMEEKKPEQKKVEAPKAEPKPPPAPKKPAPPAKPAKLVIPEIKTKTVRKYDPEFTKSVLDQPEQIQTGPTMRYSDAELNEFRDLIQKKLDQAKKELAYLQGLITRKDEMGGDETENRYMTMEDGSMSMEREQLAQMASRQISYIDHLEKAVMRIENKTYGICRVTGKLIDKARLRAVPHATLSIEAKQMMNK